MTWADPDHLIRQFGSLTDEALLEVNRAELVELAQICYDAELASRGLTAPNPPGLNTLAHTTDAEETSHGWTTPARFVPLSSSSEEMRRSVLRTRASFWRPPEFRASWN